VQSKAGPSGKRPGRALHGRAGGWRRKQAWAEAGPGRRGSARPRRGSGGRPQEGAAARRAGLKRAGGAEAVEAGAGAARDAGEQRAQGQCGGSSRRVRRELAGSGGVRAGVAGDGRQRRVARRTGVRHAGVDGPELEQRLALVGTGAAGS
jgi:hypothetical protein